MGDLPYHLAVNNAERASAVPTTTMLLKYINEHKPDAINILDNKRQTALHIAIRHASFEVVNVFLQGVDHIKVEGKDSSGMAPMDSAVQAAAYTMVLILQSYFEATGLYGRSRHKCQCCQCNSCGCSITCICHISSMVTTPVWQRYPFSGSPICEVIEQHWEIQLCHTMYSVILENKNL
jgi:hypothetical protein